MDAAESLCLVQGDAEVFIEDGLGADWSKLFKPSGGARYSTRVFKNFIPRT